MLTKNTWLYLSACLLLAMPFVHAQNINVEQQANKIDSLVLDLLKKKELKSSPEISDSTFLRRIYLDIAGRIPTLQEINAFHSSNSPSKRSDLIESLLNSKAYISHSFNYWADVLRATTKLKKVSGTNYMNFIKDALKENMPYDEFVKELLKSNGSIYEIGNGATGYYFKDSEMPLDNLANTMQTFLATDIVCAQCHDHPYDDWSQSDFYKLAAFNSGIITRLGSSAAESMDGFAGFKKSIKKTQDFKSITKLIFELLYSKVQHTGTGAIKLPHDYLGEDQYKPNQVILAETPFGKNPSIKVEGNLTIAPQSLRDKNKKRPQEQIPGNDIGARLTFADWVASPENPMFTKTIVNRLWERVMGEPLIGPLTNLSLKQDGVNEALTHELIKLMKDLDYNLKEFLSILYHTKTYQREILIDQLEPGSRNYFQGPYLQRLSSEQLWDSLISLSTHQPDISIKETSGSTPRINLYQEIKDLSATELVTFMQNNHDENLKKAFSSKDDNVTMRRKPNGGGKKKINKKKKPKQIEKVTIAHIVRASEMLSPAQPEHFLRTFGQSERTQIDDAQIEASIPQALNLMNGLVETSILNNPNSPLSQAVNQAKSLDQKINTIYEAILCRQPTSHEMQVAKKLFQQYPGTAYPDLSWVLINSHEFKFYR